jgi:hypothetical protein
MEGTISLYLQTRMKKLGYENFTFETRRIMVNKEIKEINAFNEFWYLFDVENAFENFRIRSDNTLITRPDFVSFGVPYVTREFTGNIRIDTRTATKPHTFLFYHVIPE